MAPNLKTFIPNVIALELKSECNTDLDASGQGVIDLLRSICVFGKLRVTASQKVEPFNPLKSLVLSNFAIAATIQGWRASKKLICFGNRPVHSNAFDRYAQWGRDAQRI
jgi:hypothetical protein